jgi:hypothetical protein
MYRFKIELAAWAWKTIACVLMTLLAVRMVGFFDGTWSIMPVEMRWFALHPWVFPTALWALVGLSWLCYYKIFGIMRADKRYGER